MGSVPTLKLGEGGQSWLVGYDGSSVEVPAVHAMPLLSPPRHMPPEHSGHGWTPAMVPIGSCRLSPVRYITQLSGRSRLVAPVAQLAVPVAAVRTFRTTHQLTGGVGGFGIASGAP